MKCLVIDSRLAGIGGDMLISALVDLKGDEEPLRRTAEAISGLESCRSFTFSVEKSDDSFFPAKKLSIEIEEGGVDGKDGLLEAASLVMDAIGISPAARKKAEAAFDDLLYAEKRLHRSGFNRHEIASADTLFDVIGSIALLDSAGFFDGIIHAITPVVGAGSISVRGEQVPGPAPAVLEIFARKKIPFSGRDVDMEFTTPTGAAILANIATTVSPIYPPMTPEATGYGTGTRRNNGNPSNVLRVVAGETSAASNDSIVMLETNVDDIPGEIIGYTIERLFAEGAADVFVTGAIGKKNRPVNIISVITNRQNHLRLTETLMKETGTLGVRIYEVPRLVADRTRESINVGVGNKQYQVSLKRTTVGERLVSLKPEYDDLKKIALDTGLSLRETMDIAGKEISDYESRSETEKN
ncbi:nickel pincer cofactor biosynthesis protein LarC [Methanolacinia petrolearia]|uniref:nickel pincer cofactor biosynthesis protein LarC n=1 Tax=Methanolacinia petrolearia TaxID=54120 RepID=UPI003BAADD53